jgi:hypothetical protein
MPSREFLRWSEQYLTDGKADKIHSKSISFENMMLRDPYTFYSEGDQPVMILEDWDGIRPDIRPLLIPFITYLFEKRVKRDKEARKRLKEFRASQQNHTFDNRPNTTVWIEDLIENHPIEDGRRFALWRILTPYLLNVKKLQYEQAFQIMTDYFGRCAKLRPLNFNADRQVHDNLKRAINSAVAYLPISFVKLQEERPDLWRLLQ